MSFFGIKVGVFSFFSTTTRRIYVNFFSGFKRKHLFIATCIEKHPAFKCMISCKAFLIFLSSFSTRSWWTARH